MAQLLESLPSIWEIQIQFWVSASGCSYLGNGSFSRWKISVLLCLSNKNKQKLKRNSVSTSSYSPSQFSSTISSIIYFLLLGMSTFSTAWLSFHCFDSVLRNTKVFDKVKVTSIFSFSLACVFDGACKKPLPNPNSWQMTCFLLLISWFSGSSQLNSFAYGYLGLMSIFSKVDFL